MANDDALKAEIASQWSALYKREFNKDDMSCKGCKSDALFKLCSSCHITACNKERGLENCEDCGDFPCQSYESFLEYQRVNNTGAVFE